MLNKQGWKLLARSTVLAWMATAGTGCQSLSLISRSGNNSANIQASDGRSLITLGRPEITNSSPDPKISTITSWPPTPRDEKRPIAGITDSAWSAIQRDKNQPTGVVAAGGWRPGESITKIFAAKNQEPGLTGPTLAEPPVAEAPILPSPRKLNPETSQSVMLPPPGTNHGWAKSPAPNELSKVALPPYIIETPDILLVEAKEAATEVGAPVRGQHLVRPDGTIGLGIYGSVKVSGLTLEQARKEVAATLSKPSKPVKPDDVSVDVLAYNSKVYYVITDGGGYGEQVYRFPYTGNETVLDAFSLINGLPAVASKKHVWIARRVPDDGGQYGNILPVDWEGINKGGTTGTNYQIFPGDRIYVRAQKIIRIDSSIAKFLAPIERVLGTTLLGSETVNSICNRGTNVGGVP